MSEEILKQLEKIPPREKADLILEQQQQMYDFFLIPESKPFQKQKKT